MRLYNGAPDAALQAILDLNEKATRQLHSLSPDARCTHFPMEGHYQVWLHHRPITGPYSTRIDAITAALTKLKEQQHG